MAQDTIASRGLDYRPDVDGLRAVAVMLVVLNHAGVALLSGGFIGVDVFFVISGFLITGLIVRQRGEGRFRFGAFFLRRARRLLPALYAMMLATLAAGYWLLTPSDYELLAQSALAAVALASNVFFWRETGGYFSPDATAFPLLHVWSLSVEEQFYLVWPLVLLGLLRLRSRAAQVGVVVALTVLSFAAGQIGVARAPIGAYFLPYARAGEFLLGALVFLLWRARPVASPLAANAVSGAGLALILAAAVMLDERSPFPGLAALAPCLGAALVIAAPQFGPSLAERLLSSRPFVWVGLISYSVYLWHWPLVSFLRVARVELTPAVTAGVVAGALVLGYLSWRLFERGVRRGLEQRAWPALGLAAVATAAVIAGPLFVHLRQGLPERFPYALLTQDQLLAERNRYWVDLQATNAPLKAGEAQEQLLIVGNSHAYDLAYALRENGYAGRIRLLETDHLCFNFGHDAVLPANAAYCAERMRGVLESPDLKVASAVYLHDHWGGYDPAGLADMIARIRTVTDVPIRVFGPKMVFTADALAISKEAQDRRNATVDGINAYAAGFYQPDRAVRDRELAALFRSREMGGARYVSMLQPQCGPALTCEILSPAGEYLYFDEGHFTLVGARRFGRRLKAAHPEVFHAAEQGRAAIAASRP